ncbi:MAG: hypothetical protein ABSD92_12035 [Candidatus Bathyarchaeia archaeon]
MGFLKIAKKSEVPTGKIILLEIHGKEIIITNVEGKFYPIGQQMWSHEC